MKNLMTWFPVIGVGLLLTLFAIALLRPTEGGGDPIIGQRVSDLDLPLEAVSFTQAGFAPDVLEGPYLLNVWASWCPPCRIEHPYFEYLSDQGVPIYGIIYKDEEADAARFLDQLGDPFAGLAADRDGRAGFELGVTGPPETFIVDADGVIRARWRGAVTDIVWIQRFAEPWAEAGGEPISWPEVQ
ncbi:DsbE family thiol:disulfide interchange protein [Oceanicaulis alexandrii]|uniref:DsbE family thiol:disulfide interchange protein n=1 Tax=Oceanicaulis alexandrii TaxID=153233 RepID=UPI0035CEBE7A